MYIVLGSDRRLATSHARGGIGESPRSSFLSPTFPGNEAGGDPICVFSLHAFFSSPAGNGHVHFMALVRNLSHTCKKSSFYMFPDSRQPNMAMSLILKQTLSNFAFFLGFSTCRTLLLLYEKLSLTRLKFCHGQGQYNFFKEVVASTIAS